MAPFCRNPPLTQGWGPSDLQAGKEQPYEEPCDPEEDPGPCWKESISHLAPEGLVDLQGQLEQQMVGAS